MISIKNANVFVKGLKAFTFENILTDLNVVLNSKEYEGFICPKIEFYPVAIPGEGIHYHALCYFIKKPELTKQ